MDERGAVMNRAEVEQAIRDEETALEQVSRLLQDRAALDAWPESLRVAFELALEDEHVSRAETWKVVALRRHLFGGSGTIPPGISRPPAPTAQDQRRAERLRGGLPACVGHRAGRYLLPA